MSTRSGRVRPSALESSPPKPRKGVSPPRSPARTRKSSPPARSPSRKSPARKSPSRKPATNFPARKSPSRSNKETNENAPKSPAKRVAIKSNADPKLDDVSKLDNVRPSRGRRTEYSIKDLSSSLEKEFASGDKANGVDSLYAREYGLRNRKNVDEVVPRRSSRLKEFIDTSADIKRSLSKSVSQSIDTYSDEEDDDISKKNKSKSLTRKLATPLRDNAGKLSLFSGRWEFGGRIGSAILLILVPATAISILLACTKNCNLNSLKNFSAFKSLSFWFSPTALAVIIVQYLLQAILVCFPIFGTTVDRMDDSGRKQTFNGFFATVFTLLLLFTLDFFGITSSKAFLNEFVKLALVSFILAFTLSLFLFWKSRKLDDSELNPYGNTGFFLYDLWVGREIHPFFKRLDVKLWISRICNVNSLILAVLVFKNGLQLPSNATNELNLQNYKDVLNKIEYNSTVLLFSLLQVIYVLYFILKEYKVTATFFWNSEGLGFLQLVSSALYPFYFVTISKFVLDSGLNLSSNTLIGSAALFFVGFTILLLSNNLKYEFRKNPLHPSLTYLDSMPTFHGKKLLVSNLWGIVRHPNYTGDILIHIALAIPGFAARELVPVLPAVLTVLALFYRAWRDNSRCKRRYGAAWQRYCKRVPSVLIPKVL